MIGLRKALEIGRVNLVRQLRDRGDLFFVLVLPTLIIVALGLQFGGSTAARVGVVVPAGDADAAALVELLARGRRAPRRAADRAIEATLRCQGGARRARGGPRDPRGVRRGAARHGHGRAPLPRHDRRARPGLRAPIERGGRRASPRSRSAARVAEAEGLAGWDQARAAAEAGYGSVPGVAVSVSRIGEPGSFAGFTQFTFGASTQLVMFTFLTSMTASLRLV